MSTAACFGIYLFNFFLVVINDKSYEEINILKITFSLDIVLSALHVLIHLHGSNCRTIQMHLSSLGDV